MNKQFILYLSLVFLFFSCKGESQTTQQVAREDLSLILPFAHNARISGMAFSDDGRYLISGDAEGFLKVWELNSGAPVTSFKAHESSIQNLFFSSATGFCSVDYNGEFKQWEIGKKTALKTVGTTDSPVRFIGFSPKRKLILVYYHGKYQLWDNKLQKTNAKAIKLNALPAFHDDLEFKCAGDFNFIACSDSSKIEVLNLFTAERLYSQPPQPGERLRPCSFSDDNRYFAFNLGDQVSSIVIFNIGSKKVERKFNFLELIPNQFYVGNVDATFLNGNSNFMVTAGMDSRIRLWEVKTGHEITNYEPDNMGEPTNGEFIWGISSLGSGGVSCFQIAPQNQYFVAAVKKDLSVWPLRSFIQNTEINKPVDSLVCAGIHKDNETVTVAYSDGRVANVNAETGRETGLVREAGTPVKRLRLLDQDLVFMEMEDGQLEIRSGSRQALITKINPVNLSDIYESDANKQLVVTAPGQTKTKALLKDADVQIWSAATGKKAGTIPGFETGVHKIAISNDNRYIAFSGYKKDPEQSTTSTYIRVWSVEESKLLEDTRFEYSSIIRILKFSEDGNRLIVLGPGDQFKILDVKNSCWIGHFSTTSIGPVEYAHELARGAITFIRFGDIRYKGNPTPINVGYWDSANWQRETAPYQIPFPENIAALHPAEEQILIGYSNGGVAIFNLVITLREGHTRRDGQAYPFAPYIPVYIRTDKSFLELHKGPVLDARMTKGNKVAMSIGTDSYFKQSDFFVEEEKLPSLSQWTTTDGYPSAIFPSGDTEIFVGKQNGEIYSFNLSSITPVKKIDARKTVIKTLATDPQKKWLASADASDKVILTDLLNNKNYSIYDPQYTTRKKHELLFSPSGNYLLVVDKDGPFVDVWDVVNLKKVSKFYAGRPASDIRFSADDKHVLVSYGDYEPEGDEKKINLNYFDIQTGKVTESIKEKGDYIQALNNWKGQDIAWFVADSKITARSLHLNGLTELKTIELPKAPIEQIRLTENGDAVLTIEGIFAFIHNKKTDERQYLSPEDVWTLSRRNLLKDELPLEDGRVLRVVERCARYYDLKNKKTKTLSLPQNHNEVWIINDSTLIFTTKEGLIGWMDVVQGNIKAYTYIPSDDNFICYTSDNFYYATRQIASDLYFSDGQNAYGFEQFDLIYNRPDKVIAPLLPPEASLVKLYKTAYEKRLSLMNWDANASNSRIDIPTVELLKVPENVITKNQKFTLSYKANSGNSTLDRIQVSVNGVPIFGRNGETVSGNKKSIQKEITFLLNQKENLIRISAYNKEGIASNPISLSVFYEVPEVKPDLFVLAIGVSNYLSQDKDLKYAAKDARDVVSQFEKATAFKEVHTKTLIDGQVTKANISAMHEWLKTTTADDQVLVFVSGHGDLVNGYDFYYATHDMDFDNPAQKGMRYDDIEGLLDAIPARKKLLIIDACFSGEVDKNATPMTPAQQKSLQNKGVSIKAFPKGDKGSGPVIDLRNSFELMQVLFADLRSNTGATVITSSSGMQVSYEDVEWQNGAFTFAFLYGLKSMKADTNQDGQITASEIQAFVAEFVPRLTEGLQAPTFRRENLEFDFRVW